MLSQWALQNFCPSGGMQLQAGFAHFFSLITSPYDPWPSRHTRSWMQFGRGLRSCLAMFCEDYHGNESANKVITIPGSERRPRTPRFNLIFDRPSRIRPTALSGDQRQTPPMVIAFKDANGIEFFRRVRRFLRIFLARALSFWKDKRKLGIARGVRLEHIFSRISPKSTPELTRPMMIHAWTLDRHK